MRGKLHFHDYNLQKLLPLGVSWQQLEQMEGGKINSLGLYPDSDAFSTFSPGSLV